MMSLVSLLTQKFVFLKKLKLKPRARNDFPPPPPRNKRERAYNMVILW